MLLLLTGSWLSQFHVARALVGRALGEAAWWGRRVREHYRANRPLWWLEGVVIGLFIVGHGIQGHDSPIADTTYAVTFVAFWMACLYVGGRWLVLRFRC